MSMNDKEYHELIKELRDERVDVQSVYIEKPATKDTIEEIILEEPYYDADVEPEQAAEIVQEIYDIADNAVIAHLMDSAETELPVYSMKKDLNPHKEADMNDKYKDTFTGFEAPEFLLIETEETADVVDHIDMGELIGLMQRNWKELKQLTVKQIRDAMINVYNDKNPIAVEAAVDTALYLIRAEEKAA